MELVALQLTGVCLSDNLGGGGVIIGNGAQRPPSEHDWTPEWDWTQPLRWQRSVNDRGYNTEMI